MGLSKEEVSKLKSEIQKLEKMREGKKGEKVGFFKKAQINKAINDRNKLLKNEFKLLQAKQQSSLNAEKMKIAKEKAALAKVRREGMITEEDIFGKKDLFSI